MMEEVRLLDFPHPHPRWRSHMSTLQDFIEEHEKVEEAIKNIKQLETQVHMSDGNECYDATIDTEKREISFRDSHENKSIIIPFHLAKPLFKMLQRLKVEESE